MTNQILLALAMFALVTSITPGPNNLMLMASGANFGFRRTLPHMLGVAIGFVVLLSVTGLGLAQIFEAYPMAHSILAAVGAAYMVYLAWKIANSGAPAGANTSGSPLTFLQAALFQWVNPKAWAMALTAVSLYVPENTPAAIFLVAVVFGIVNLPSVWVWVILGLQLRRVLTNPARLRAFNWTMAGLLLASLIPLIADPSSA